MRENKFYVYAHRRADNGAIFYIGKGWGNRAKAKTRTEAWDKVCAEAGGFHVEIIAAELSDEEARCIEALKLAEHWGDVVNKRRRDIKPVTAMPRTRMRVDIDAELLEWLKDWRMSQPALAPFNRALEGCIRFFRDQQESMATRMGARS